MKCAYKIVISIVCALAALRMSGAPASAHGSGPPYVLVNDDYAVTNPVLNIAQPTVFAVGADVASVSGYLVNTEVTFAIDEQFFPNPYVQAQSPFGMPVANVSDIPKPIFRWDFKDGSPKQEGSTLSHVFTKPGTYMVELEAKFVGKTNEFAMVNTIQMDVFPSKAYIKPMPRIAVDGVTIEDPDRDTAPIKPMQPVVFDVIDTGSGSRTYQWDFGDGKGASEKTVTHRYGRDEYFPVAVLRMTDEYQIISDTYVLLDMPFERPNSMLKLWYTISDFFMGLFYR
jgi:chitodextrinase